MKLSAHLVSVIIPLYNAERYIEETLRSVFAQTWTKLEIIVVDDGSIDSSLAIVKSFQAENLQILSQENKGASAARNKGLQVAKGQYIQFLDADDLLPADKIEKQLTALTGQPGKVAICATVHYRDGESHLAASSSAHEDSFLTDDNDPLHFLIHLWGGYTRHGSMISVHSWLTPRPILEKAGYWDERLSMDDDGEFFCRAVLNSDGVVVTDTQVFYRRQRIDFNSLSFRNDLKSYESMLLSCQLKKKALLARTDSFEGKLCIFKMLMNLAVHSYLPYPGISRAAIAELPDINYRYQFVMGGRVSTAFSNYLVGAFQTDTMAGCEPEEKTSLKKIPGNDRCVITIAVGKIYYHRLTLNLIESFLLWNEGNGIDLLVITDQPGRFERFGKHGQIQY